MTPPSHPSGGGRLSGATPSRNSINARTLGTYIRVSDGRSSAIAAKSRTRFF